MREEAVHDILGVQVHDMTRVELRERLRGWLSKHQAHTMVTPNPEIILAAQKDQVFRDILNAADISVPDGAGLAYAVAALSDRRLEHRQTGVDLLEELAALCAKEGKSLLLFGGENENAAAAAVAFLKRYPTLDVHAYEPGTIALGAQRIGVAQADLDAVRLQKPAVLAVGLGQGKQERFLAEYLPTFPSVRIAIGIGGAFDTIGGRLPRAPLWMRRVGIEWLWRLHLEPHRLPRILRAIFVFPTLVIFATLKQHRFLRACRNVFLEFFRRS